MFDDLAHGLSFVASNLLFQGIFFKKVRHNCQEIFAFTYALKALDGDYEAYSQRVNGFKVLL
jgi:hypothetical protein